MKLVDNAGVFARIIDTRIAADRIRGAVIARPTFRVERGALVPTPDEPWPVSLLPVATACGLLPGDTPFDSSGIDVILGGAIQVGSAPLALDLDVGPRFHRRILVPIDRRGVGETRLERASGLELGYHAGDADRFPRCAAGLDLRFAGRRALEHLPARAFNHAGAAMILPFADAPAPGEIVTLTHGLASGGALRFAMPDLALHAHLTIGHVDAIHPLRLDQIGIVAGEARGFFSLRAGFAYRPVRGERACLTLHPGRAPAAQAMSQAPGARDAWEHDWPPDEPAPPI